MANQENEKNANGGPLAHHPKDEKAPGPPKAKTGPNMLDNIQSKDIALSSIEVDEAFNIRKTYEGIDELRRSIESAGLRNPLTVWEHKPGKFLLTSGYRRHKALTAIASDRALPDMIVLCTVARHPTRDDAMLANAAENTERDDVPAYQLAERFFFLENDRKLERKKIATSVGLSVAHVGNLIRAWTGLEPSILAMWCNPEHAEKLPLGHLFKWSSKSHEEQLEAYRQWSKLGKPDDDGNKQRGKLPLDEVQAEEGLAAREDKEAAEAEEGPKATKSGVLTKATIAARLADFLEMKKDKKDNEKTNAYAKALRWVLGEISELR